VLIMTGLAKRGAVLKDFVKFWSERQGGCSL